MTNELFSIYYGGITKIIPDENINIQELLKELCKQTTKTLIDKIRTIEDKKERNKIKKYLPYVTISGVFEKRNADFITTQSGYAAIDIDCIENNTVEDYKKIFGKDKYVHLIFTSPSGNGLKLIIKLIKSKEEFGRRVSNFYDYLTRQYNIKIDTFDTVTKDISRACYLSYDPDYIYNPESVVFEGIDVKCEMSAVLGVKKDNSRSAVEYREIIKLLYIGKSKEQIYKELENFQKWQESTEAYRTHTYHKAVDYVEHNKPSGDYKEELIQKITEEIENKFHIYTTISDKHPDVYIYKDGIYVPNGKVYLHKFVEKCVGKYYTKLFAEKILEKVIIKTYILAEELFSEPDPKFICVQNGILDIFTGDLYNFTPKLRFFSKLPVIYKKNAKTQHTINHFKSILYSEDVELMQEIYGFLLYRKYEFQRAFIFSGDGSNGKSVTLDQIKSFLGIENCANLSLETLESGNVMKGVLHKKLANLADDIGKSKLNETRTFKELTGAGIITADVKFCDPITFTNYAKMIFNANQIPIIDDDSDGLWRRWIFIRFDKNFLSPKDYEQRKQNKKLHKNHALADSKLSDKLTTPEELSGVLNWAIEGFIRLMKNKDFSYTKNLEETRKIMKKYSSSVLGFSHDCLKQINSVDQYEVLSDVYSSYVEYCFSRKKRISPESEKMFRKMIQEDVVVQTKRTANSREYRCMYVKMLPIPEDI